MSKFIIFIGLLFCTIGLQAQKIAYLNSQEIMAAMPEVKQANSVIEDMKNMITKKGQDMVQTLQAKYQTLQAKQQSGELAPVEIEKQAAALKVEEESIMKFEQSSQKEVADKTTELLGPIEQKVNQAIKDVAAEMGYMYIFDEAMGLVLYADPSNNVTKAVAAKLGITL
ncbi:MAG: OmpH family outer membrane protein [Saprospiraceae bacterium]|nr:OmpH family outer membrane protein [Saprospiraceae bacterium]MCB9308669.1 OmpH family outer membrane protein [Lewinellaceae bacterium]